jgi:DNA-binding NarL/FixJ family response regulator
MRVLEYIKGHFPASKVYVVSSESGVETQKACFRAGADGFLSKPLDIERLLSAVRNSTLACQLVAA